MADQEHPVYEAVEDSLNGPEGFKQTEVGLIPTDWRVCNLAALLKEQPRYGINAAAVKLVGNLPTYIRITDISEDGYFRPEEKVGVRSPHCGDYLVQRGDILLARTGASVGKSYLYRTSDGELVFAGFLIKVSPNTRVLNPGYLHQFLKTRSYWNWVTVNSMRSGQPGINGNEYASMPLPVPSLVEQTAIANALSDVDDLIGSMENLIAKKQAIKTATMQQLLTGRTRLAGFSGKWEAVQLGDVAAPNRRCSFTGGPFGSNLKSSDFTEAGIRIIQLQNIGDGEFKDNYEIYTSEAKADELTSCNIFPGEIILSKMGDPVARACIIPSRHDRYLMCSDGIRLAVDPDRFDTYFIYTQINAPDFRDRATNAGTGSTRKRIGLTELRRLELDCPPLVEQTAIAEVLRNMDEELAALKLKLSKTHALKQGMMQELLTGRTRLVTPEHQGGAA